MSGEIEDLGVVAPLITALKDWRLEVCWEAANALQKNNGARLWYKSKKYQRWWKENKESLK